MKRDEDTLVTIHTQAYAAFWSGGERTQNPYKRETTEWQVWDSSFMELFEWFRDKALKSGQKINND